MAVGLMEIVESGNATDVKECLSFRLGAEEYGIDILAVREIRAFERPTRIASAPAFILGVINLRGVIVPIVDLRIKFGVGEAAYDGTTVVIILNVANRVLGIVVDSVSDVLPLKDEEIRAAPEFSAAIEASFVRGLASVNERLLILVDIEMLMMSPGMALVREAALAA
jgi:purine-binding chemotaxis protein CheW